MKKDAIRNSFESTFKLPEYLEYNAKLDTYKYNPNKCKDIRVGINRHIKVNHQWEAYKSAMQSAQEEIERLKCCGNCEYEAEDFGCDMDCIRDKFAPVGTYYDDNWEAKV